ncbi:YARHG domain-containing protein [Aquimarina sp. MMG016]|uniref:YARHG domain-containing protein n=1 Tax=Aquimarina sp. MMG016 TaxID=2822690 RepID=UPI001B3A5A0A|nr:YARHG domain-containing protein [Aquimarina sp. MMG016]MBQ4822615.1 YARHG domain-containing protein [Aquimarina sp. MMG016]
MRILFLAITFLVSNSYAQQNNFNALIQLFDTSGTEIPKDLSEIYFGFKPTEDVDKLLTDRIIVQTDNYIAFSTKVSCDAGKQCEIYDLTTFNLKGEQMGKTVLRRTMIGCSFNDTRELIYESDSLFVFKETRQKLNCLEDKKIMGQKVWLEFLPVADNGEFRRLITEIISLDRDHYDASISILNESDLLGKTKEELAVIRNEIFASHGYIFKTPKWQNFFAPKPWYDPTETNVTNKLTVIEKKNLELIKNMEVN